MKIASWNVNGIRAVIKKGFADFLMKEKPDILCLQETKIAQKDIDQAEFDYAGYQEYWNPASRPGYSGTAMLVRADLAPEPALPSGRAGMRPGAAKAERRSGFILPKLDWDDEGRVQIADLGRFYLANIYFPNANHELSRLGFKLKFNDKLLSYLKDLEKKKALIICGDFNVAHEEIDLARPKDNVKNAGFTPEERAWMTKFLRAGFVDTFRHFYPDKAQYSWWSYRFFARKKNIGWRIDYFCVSAKILKIVKKAFILGKVQGSDHCPVGIEIADK